MNPDKQLVDAKINLDDGVENRKLLTLELFLVTIQTNQLGKMRLAIGKESVNFKYYELIYKLISNTLPLLNFDNINHINWNFGNCYFCGRKALVNGKYKYSGLCSRHKNEADLDKFFNIVYNCLELHDQIDIFNNITVPLTKKEFKKLYQMCLIKEEKLRPIGSVRPIYWDFKIRKRTKISYQKIKESFL